MNMSIIHLRSQMFPLDVWGFPEKKEMENEWGFLCIKLQHFLVKRKPLKEEGS